MRAATYHRVSTVDQEPETARTELRAAARARGAELVLEVEETGSGARNDRPGLQRILDAARRGQIETVLVWKLDRFGRSALDLLANVRALESAGVRFVAVTQGLDIRADGDAMSRLILTVLAAVAEFERELIRDRTKAGLTRVRREGTASGRPIGRPAVAVDADRARALLKAGYSYQRTATELGVSRSTLRKLFPGWQKRVVAGGPRKSSKTAVEGTEESGA